MATVLNFTPHNPLRIFVADTEVAALPAAGDPVRLNEAPQPAWELPIEGHRIPVVTMHYGSSEGLPDPVPGTVLVVSQLVCRANPGREDLVFPVDLVRNAIGDIVGCRGFAKAATGS
jgi:hypothetical protein